MKQLILALLIGFAPMLTLQAQPEEKTNDALESIKIAFISKQLSLTPEEAQKFWPLYNQYTSEIKRMRKDHVGDEIDWQEKALNVAKRYRPEFLKTINQEKFNRLLKVDRDWKDKIRQQIEQRKQQRQDAKRNNRPGTKF